MIAILSTIKQLRNGVYVSELSKFKKPNNLFVFDLSDISIVEEKIVNLRRDIEATDDDNEIKSLNVELKTALAEYNNLKSQRALAAKYGFINESNTNLSILTISRFFVRIGFIVS